MYRRMKVFLPGMKWMRVSVIKRFLQVYCAVSAAVLLYLVVQSRSSHHTNQEKKNEESLPETSQTVLTRVPVSNIYIFSVIGINSTDKRMWDIFTVNVWIYQPLASSHISCCFQYRNGDVKINKVFKINQRTEMFNQSAQVECQNPNSQTTSQISGVSLTVQEKCATETRMFVRPELAKKPPGKFNMAVCAKLAYDNLNPHLTIEWMEYNKAMGVGHVLAYTYNLSKRASSVLTHYESSGFLELHKIDYPYAGTSNHRIGDKSTPAWTDEQVVVHDCQARLSGYDYVAVIDLDEFLVPLKDRNFEKMLRRLMRLIPATGCINFFSEIYVTDWGPTNRDRDLHITQFLNRTASQKPIPINQRKAIHIPARTQRGSVVTHGCKVIEGCKIWKDPTVILGMNHYRPCVAFWRDCFTRNRTTDNRIVKHVDKIIPSVSRIKSTLLQHNTDFR